jgi:hypothetical protein
MEAKRDKRGRPKAVLVKRQHRNLNEPDLWMLPDTPRIRETKYYHTKACGDLYASFGNLCDDWYSERSIGDLVPDCTMVYQGKKVYFEVDRGNEPFPKLAEKIQKYIQLSHHEDKVIFVLDDGVRSAKQTGYLLDEYLKELRRGRHFSYTALKVMVTDPLGQWLFNPLNERLTITELCSAS